MALQAQFGGVIDVPAAYFYGGSLEAGEVDYGALLSTAAPKANYAYNCAAVASGAQSDLTCNNGAGGEFASRKRGREAEQYAPSSAALLPIPGMTKAAPCPAVDAAFSAAASRMVDSAVTSTSGRPAAASPFAGSLVSELYQQDAEIDALVRAECERLRAGLEQARKRQCQALLRAASLAAAQQLREKEAELDAARRRAADLEERLRQAAAESQAWCGLARSNQAVVAGLRATLDHLLRAAPAPALAPEEGFGESDPACGGDAQSCFFAANDASQEEATSSPAGKWACKSCGEREASVLVLPCRHLCLCMACEPKLDACPVCLAAKNACVVARSPTEVC